MRSGEGEIKFCRHYVFSSAVLITNLILMVYIIFSYTEEKEKLLIQYDDVLLQLKKYSMMYNECDRNLKLSASNSDSFLQSNRYLQMQIHSQETVISELQKIISVEKSKNHELDDAIFNANMKLSEVESLYLKLSKILSIRTPSYDTKGFTAMKSSLMKWKNDRERHVLVNLSLENTRKRCDELIKTYKSMQVNSKKISDEQITALNKENSQLKLNELNHKKLKVVHAALITERNELSRSHESLEVRNEKLIEDLKGLKALLQGSVKKLKSKNVQCNNIQTSHTALTNAYGELNKMYKSLHTRGKQYTILLNKCRNAMKIYKKKDNISPVVDGFNNTFSTKSLSKEIGTKVNKTAKESIKGDVKFGGNLDVNGKVYSRIVNSSSKINKNSSEIETVASQTSVKPKNDAVESRESSKSRDHYDEYEIVKSQSNKISEIKEGSKAENIQTKDTSNRKDNLDLDDIISDDWQ